MAEDEQSKVLVVDSKGVHKNEKTPKKVGRPEYTKCPACYDKLLVYTHPDDAIEAHAISCPMVWQRTDMAPLRLRAEQRKRKGH